MNDLEEGRLEHFYNAFRDAFEVKGFSQTDLSLRSKVPKATISNLFNRTAGEPKPSTVFALERALGVQPGELGRHLGYVPVDKWVVDRVEAAIGAEHRLSVASRKVIVQMYKLLLAGEPRGPVD